MLIRISTLKQKVISRPIAALAIFSIFVVFGVLAGIVYSQGDPSTPSVNPGTNFQVCTGGVNQDACYSFSTSITRLNWTYSSAVYGQMAFWVQVDNNGSVGGAFPSPEINTGWINSANGYYDVLPGSLQPNTTYYWKVAVADTHSSWSGWTYADTSFTTPPSCAPTTNITAGATTIPYNTSATISWSSSNATSCVVSPPGWTGTSGSQSTGNLTSPQTYTITCTGPAGSISDSVTVNLFSDFSLINSGSIYATLVKSQPGVSSETTLTITSLAGFSSNVNLSVQSVNPSLPSGTTFSFTLSTLTSAQYSSGSKFKVNIGSGLTASQTYTIVVQGVGGGLTRTSTVYLNVAVKQPGWQEF